MSWQLKSKTKRNRCFKMLINAMLNQWDAEKEVSMFPRAAATLKHHHHGTCVCGCSYWGCQTEPVNSVHVHLNARVETRKDEPLLFKGLPSDSSRSSSASCSRTSWGRADTSTPRSAIMARNRGEERRRNGLPTTKMPVSSSQWKINGIK